MNQLIHLKTITLPLLTALALACFGLSPCAQAVVPAPDGGYPGNNTAEGDSAMFDLDVNTSTDNTAIGNEAMELSTVTFFNTAVGSQAMEFGGSGIANVAIGFETLFQNGSGGQNTAVGASAMVLNGSGSNNTAVGEGALFNNNGDNNIAIGSEAGINLTTGSNNIDIGHDGNAAETNTIRIGKKGVQTKTVIAGIRGTTVSGGITVFIDTNGRLGTSTSSARFKDGIKPMDKASEAILSLEPVTFRYKKDIDPEGMPQFGLVAEQVNKIDPDLVVRDDDGKPYTVRYEAVNAMLLNEFLKEHHTVQDLRATVARQQKQIEALTAGLQKVSAQLELNKRAPETVSNNE